MLEVRNITKIYNPGALTEQRLFEDFSLTVEDGEFVAIVGTSGSGKSTLLHMLGGLDRPTGGSVLVEGRDIFALKDEELTIFRRRKIGFVFQSYNLVPVLTVRENIVLPIQLDGGKVDEAYVGEVISALGLEKKLDNLPSQLSGGQQQRVALARARATNPPNHLAGPGHQARHFAGRRAHRQPGQPHQPGRAVPHEGHRPEVRPDHGDDHPQRGDRPALRPDRPHRGRPDRDAVRGRKP